MDGNHASAADEGRMTETAAYEPLGDDTFRASALTGGPWSPEHQHAGPPSALIARAIERAAAPHGLTHLGRLTVNLLRPLPIGDCHIEVKADQIGRGAGHFSGSLTAGDKEIAIFTRPPPAAGAKVLERVRAGAVRLLRQFRLCSAGRKPGRRRGPFSRPLRGLVPAQSPAGRGRGAELLCPRRRRRRFRQRHQRGAGFCQIYLRQLRSHHQPVPPPRRRMDLPRREKLVRRQ